MVTGTPAPSLSSVAASVTFAVRGGRSGRMDAVSVVAPHSTMVTGTMAGHYCSPMYGLPKVLCVACTVSVTVGLTVPEGLSI